MIMGSGIAPSHALGRRGVNAYVGQASASSKAFAADSITPAARIGGVRASFRK